MEFEWDEAKRQWNIENRGLDFTEAERLDLSTSTTLLDRRKEYGEDRFVTLGLIEGRLYVLCWTERAGRRRIISFRKANQREQDAFAASSTRPPRADG